MRCVNGWGLNCNVFGVLVLALGLLSGCSPKGTAKVDPDCPVTHLDGPAIDVHLPDLSSVRDASASLVQSRVPDVEVKVPESDWADLVALFTDSRPVEIECEMSLLTTIRIVTKNGESRIVYIYDNFPPIVFAVKTQARLSYFATDKSSEEVLGFFEAFAIK